MSDPVKQFRKLTGGRTSPVSPRPPLPPREKALLSLLLINVLWLSFALGGVRLWGEATAFFLSVATLALLPSWKNGELTGIPDPVWSLLKLPLFWAGFGLYTYFFLTSWNLSWEWTLVPDGRPRLMAQTPAVPWLPSGFVSPMDESNPFRSMLFYTIPWMAACSAWAGLNTRRANLLLLNGLALCGLAFSVVALGQHFFGAGKILGIFQTVPQKQGLDLPFWGTLINENHAAMYLILVNGLCLGLFLSGWDRDMRHFRKGGGAWLLYLAFSIMTTFSVIMAVARGATFLVVIQWLLFLLTVSVILVRWFGKKGFILPAGLAVLLLALVASFVTNPLFFERYKREWTRSTQTLEQPGLEARYSLMLLSRDMILDKPWYGHGPGGFRYFHLPYLAEYPELMSSIRRSVRHPETNQSEPRTLRIWYQHAHVDLMEYLVEWGIVGCLFPALALGWLALTGWRSRRGWDPGTLTILMGLLLLLLGAIFEFHFRIPLILLAWCLTLTAVVKLAKLRT